MSSLRSFRVSPRAFVVLVRITIGVFVLITVSGAAVRLTGSGLGCEDWPTCNDNKVVAEIDDLNAMIEFGNRVISGLVAIPVVACVVAARRRDPRRRDLVRLSWAQLAVLAVEIPLGGWTVLSGLTPAIVAAHFLVAIALIAMAVVLDDRAGQPDGPPHPVVDPGVRRWTWAALAAACAVLVSGTVVTGSGPHSGDEDVGRLGLDITDAVRVHSLAMWVLLGLSTAALWFAYRGGATAEVRRRGGVLVAAVVGQAAIGYTQYAIGVPAWLVGLHILGSCIVWIALWRFHLGLVRRDAGALPGTETERPDGALVGG